MKVIIRGASPVSVQTWAELSVLPRPGDVVTIEDNQEGRSYVVTSVQFDLRPRFPAEGTGTSQGQERWLREDGIVVHVMPEGGHG